MTIFWSPDKIVLLGYRILKTHPGLIPVCSFRPERAVKFALDEVREMARLISEACNPRVARSNAARRRLFAEGLAKLVNADVYIWSQAVVNPDVPGDVMTTSLIDGGWRDEQQRMSVYQALTDVPFTTEIQREFVKAACGKVPKTFLRSELLEERRWDEIRGLWDNTALDAMLLSAYPLGDGNFSAVGLHRRKGKPPFSVGDKAIVEIMFENVDGLHRQQAADVINESVVGLSPRQRQVLMMLLAGESIKDIARQLDISEHTVGDYVKQLHKTFDVTSRAELQAKFFLDR
jgi:DNA-binding CsgD family transcriptional regulator